jgi:hypothetical protein
MDRFRLAHPECARLSIEYDTAVVYHHLDNDREMHMEGQGESAVKPEEVEGGEGGGEEEEEEEAGAVQLEVPGLDPIYISRGQLVFPLALAPAIEVCEESMHDNLQQPRRQRQ